MEQNSMKVNKDFNASLNKEESVSIQKDASGNDLDMTSKSNLDLMLEQYQHRDTEDDDTFFEKGRNQQSITQE